MSEEADPSTVSLADFCRLKSAERKQVELLAGFHHDERSHQRLTDTVANYEQRYQQFADRPITQG